MNKLVVSALALIASTQMSFAIVATGNATAVILQAITATQNQQMHFGTVTPLVSSGIVTLSSAGLRSSGTHSVYGTSAAGQFTITAAPSTALTISFSNATLTSGANNMTVNNYTTTSVPASNTTSAGGSLALNVGADLNVGANQATGVYTGTYNMTVSY